MQIAFAVETTTEEVLDGIDTVIADDHLSLYLALVGRKLAIPTEDDCKNMTRNQRLRHYADYYAYDGLGTDCALRAEAVYVVPQAAYDIIRNRYPELPYWR